MSGADFLDFSTAIGLGGLLVAVALTAVRLLLGPTLPDRILALDTMTTLGVAMIAVFAIRSSVLLYVDIAIAVSLVSFLATVAFARYVTRLGRP